MQISFQIADMGDLVDRRLSKTLEPFGVLVWEYRLLLILVERGSMTAAEVIPQITLEQSLVSRTVQRLYEKGLLSRRRSRSDRRAVTLRATDAGAKLVGRLEQPLHELEEELLLGISTGQVEHATQVMAAMTRNLKPRR